MLCTGSYGMRVPVRWSQCLDKASASITSPRAIWSSSRRLHISSLTSTYPCSTYHPRSYAVLSMWNYGLKLIQMKFMLKLCCNQKLIKANSPARTLDYKNLRNALHIPSARH